MMLKMKYKRNGQKEKFNITKNPAAVMLNGTKKEDQKVEWTLTIEISQELNVKRYWKYYSVKSECSHFSMIKLSHQDQVLQTLLSVEQEDC